MIQATFLALSYASSVNITDNQNTSHLSDGYGFEDTLSRKHLHAQIPHIFRTSILSKIVYQRTSSHPSSCNLNNNPATIRANNSSIIKEYHLPIYLFQYRINYKDLY
ncbi:hypothetical protein OCU04_001163 [Sclerotinia nivalis]|uniref:Uncharacterized protein n=1 Tax=Sclerotinia nivalis TaxID=352851 RepID=A0A9X0DP48_9HELO|nr:hypothetical protein OCU04_001163 [Sclerotinia nivalis]